MPSKSSVGLPELKKSSQDIETYRWAQVDRSPGCIYGSWQQVSFHSVEKRALVRQVVLQAPRHANQDVCCLRQQDEAQLADTRDVHIGGEKYQVLGQNFQLLPLKWLRPRTARL